MRRRLATFVTLALAGGCDPASMPPPPPAAPVVSDEGSIVSAPLEPAPARPEGPLFELLDPQRTGVDFRYSYRTDEEFQEELSTAAPGMGVAIGDADGDGRPDLFLTRPFGGCRLYRNLGEFRFEDVTEAAGLADPRWGSGATFVDIDNDGDLDLYVCGFETTNRLWINDGRGRFVERAKSFGLDVTGYSTTMAFSDYDRDGRLDAYLLTGYRIIQDFPDRWQDFFDIPAPGKLVPKPGLEETARVIEIPGRDPIVRQAAQRDRLFRNLRGRFVETTGPAGLSGFDAGLGVIWWDYDQDGWPDVYVANDVYMPDQLWRNNRDGTFTNVAAEAFGHMPHTSMGIDVGDVDNDGLPDLVATDMLGISHFKAKVGMGNMGGRNAWILTWGEPRQAMQNALHINTGTGRFLEAASMAGIVATDWTWAARLLDLDLDGREDLFTTTGFMRDVTHSDLIEKQERFIDEAFGSKEAAYYKFWRDGPVRAEPNLAFRNLGSLSFQKVGPAWGLDHDGVSFGAAAGDLDGDGDPDLVVGNFEEPAWIYRNGAAARRVKIRLVGTQSNRWGVDAVVTLEAGGLPQRRHLATVRGYLSADEPVLLFGLGEASTIDRLEVRWPSGRVQRFANLEADRFYTITEPRGPAPAAAPAAKAEPLLAPVEALKGIEHVERPFDDFRFQSLLPNKMSQLGPGVAVADLNGDGRDDLFVGGATDQLGVLAVSREGGFWTRSTPPQIAWARPLEDMGVLFFDADGDGDQDLFVVSGTYEIRQDDSFLTDHLYLNNGQGSFQLAKEQALPVLGDAGSGAAAADFDRDGDLDLFVGSRMIPGEYPLSPTSRLLRNDGGTFVEATDAAAPGLAKCGMVTSALWSDADGDGWTDLLVTTEYGPVRFFRNEAGTLRERTRESGLTAWSGWWNGIAGRDFDGDGDLDYAVTNFGLNTKYHASAEHPQMIYYGEPFEGEGPQIIEAGYEEGELYPVRGKSCSSRAMAPLKGLFPTFESFAKAPLPAIYPKDWLQKAQRWEATELRSGVLVNLGGGRFEFRPFPRLAQTAPAFGVVATELNGDGKADVAIVQNFYTPQPETARMDGGVGMVLLGRGDGSFEPIRADRSGLVVPADGKGLAVADFNADGQADLVATENDGQLKAFENRTRGSFGVRLRGRGGNPTAVGGRVTWKPAAGGTQTAEVHAGGSYLSSSSPVLYFGTAGAGTLEVRWPSGRTSTHESRVTGGVVELAEPAGDGPAHGGPGPKPEVSTGAAAPPPQADPRTGPAFSVTVREIAKDGRPAFRVEGKTPMPDGTVVEIKIYYDRVDSRWWLGESAVRVEKGAFAADYSFFKERNFPGPYRLLVAAPRPRQPAAVTSWLRGRDLTLSQEIEHRLGTEEDVARARQAHVDALRAAFDRVDRIRDAILAYPKPGDAAWEEAVHDWVRRAEAEGLHFRGRAENVVFQLHHLSYDVFETMAAAVEELCAVRRIGGGVEARRRPVILARLERYRIGYLHLLGVPSKERLRAAELFDVLTQKPGAADPSDPEFLKTLLELGAILPKEAQEAVQAVAQAAAEAPPEAAGREELRDRLLALQPWVEMLRQTDK
jgi:hypothetical protein